jgi:hypothetical protein
MPLYCYQSAEIREAHSVCKWEHLFANDKIRFDPMDWPHCVVAISHDADLRRAYLRLERAGQARRKGEQSKNMKFHLF